MKRTGRLLVALLVLLVAAGSLFLIVKRRDWESFVDADQMAVEAGMEAVLGPGQPAGQTFVARHAGLRGIEFYLLPDTSIPTSVTLHLRTDSQSDNDLVTSVLPLPSEARPGFYRFAFPPIDTSHGRYYYAFLEASKPGISVALATGDAYLDGAAYMSHEPLDAQTTFRLLYAPTVAIFDLLKASLGWVGLLVVAMLLFVVPGWALLVWLLPDRPLPWAELLGLAVGVSLALYPLLLLWTRVVGLRLGVLNAWLPVVLGLAALIWRYRAWRPRQALDTLKLWVRSQVLWPDLTLIAVLGIVFGARFLVVRTLEAPMWADSVEHGVIAQLLLDHGGLFESWDPYTPYRSLTVHFGFPTVAALLAWALGENSVDATLLAGQLVNGLAVLTLVPLAVRIADGNRWAGVGAVLVAGLMSPMPAHYVNWGRFAQLTGQAILPVALWLMWEVMEKKRLPWKAVGLASLVAAGLTLAYYRMPFYYAVFVIAWLAGWGIPHWKWDAQAWLIGLARLAMLGAAIVLLLLPLGARVAGGSLAGGLSAGVTAGSNLKAVLADYAQWRLVDFYVPWPILAATLIALAWSLWQRRWMVASVGLWIAGLSSLVAARLIHLPGANYMQSFAILIALYIPVSLLVGWLIGQAAEPLRRRNKQWLLSLAVLALAGWGTMGQIKILEPSRILVTRPDMQAMAWIRENTPPTSRFLVEGLVYQGFSAIGADAGWWIPLLAERENTMPPQYALLAEVPATPGYSQSMVDLVKHLRTHSAASQETIDLLCDLGITHIYVGQHQIKEGVEVERLFSAADLVGSPAFSQVYHQDRVWVFTLDPQVCEGEQ